MMKRPIFYTLLGLVLLLTILFSNFNKDLRFVNSKVATPSVSQITDKKTYLVSRVVDGDTIEIEGKVKVRYIGIDTPETVDPRRPVGCFGNEASNKNKELVLGKQVRLEKDISETDKYGRLLRYVYVGNVFVNKYLVEEGFARATSHPPNVKYQEIFRAAEKTAQEGNKGLWGSCFSGNL